MDVPTNRPRPVHRSRTSLPRPPPRIAPRPRAAPRTATRMPLHALPDPVRIDARLTGIVVVLGVQSDALWVAPWLANADLTSGGASWRAVSASRGCWTARIQHCAMRLLPRCRPLLLARYSPSLYQDELQRMDRIAGARSRPFIGFSKYREVLVSEYFHHIVSFDFRPSHSTHSIIDAAPPPPTISTPSPTKYISQRPPSHTTLPRRRVLSPSVQWCRLRCGGRAEAAQCAT